MKKLLNILLVLIATSAFASDSSIQFTFVPPVGSSDKVTGIVQNIDKTTNRIALAINVFGSWWTKPSWDAPLSQIASDGTFSISYNTGGQDGCAQQIAAFVVPKDYGIPLLKGYSSIPAEIYGNSIARVIVTRATFSVFNFAGRQWKKKDTGDCYWGPGTNYFSSNNVYVDTSERLHLSIAWTNGEWRCAEAVLTETLGYGIYRFHIDSDVRHLPDDIVLGLFTWSDDTDYAHREIDVEFSNGSMVGTPNPWQNVIQPWNTPGNRYRFSAPTNMDKSVHQFLWTSNAVYFDNFTNYSGDAMTYQIQGSETVAFRDYSNLIAQQVTGSTNASISLNNPLGLPPMLFMRASLDSLSGTPPPFQTHIFTNGIPPSSNETVHLNLWLNSTATLVDHAQTYEVIISDFKFIPLSQIPRAKLGTPKVINNTTLTVPFTYSGN